MAVLTISFSCPKCSGEIDFIYSEVPGDGVCSAKCSKCGTEGPEREHPMTAYFALADMPRDDRKLMLQVWWGKCRTCDSWFGNRDIEDNTGECMEGDSPHFEEKTGANHTCKKWDPWDVNLAFDILEEGPLDVKRKGDEDD